MSFEIKPKEIQVALSDERTATEINNSFYKLYIHRYTLPYILSIRTIQQISDTHFLKNETPFKKKLVYNFNLFLR